MPQSAVQKVRVVRVCIHLGSDGQDIRHIYIHVLNRNALQNLQGTLSIRDASAALPDHCRERIADFPGNGSGTDKRMTRSKRNDWISFRFHYNASNNSRPEVLKREFIGQELRGINFDQSLTITATISDPRPS